MHIFPVGKQIFRGIPFEIIDPEKNNGKSCIVLRGRLVTKTGFLPNKIERIKVGEKVTKLFFLISGACVSKEKGTEIGKLRMIYQAEGQGMFGTQEIRLISGKNIKDWWHPYDLPDAIVGWKGLSGKKDDIQALHEVGVYIIEWTNPAPDRAIRFIDFYSNEISIPILIAITGEEL